MDLHLTGPHILSTEPRKGTQVGEVQNNDKFIGERGERRNTPWRPENKDGNQIRQRPREWSEENQFLEAQWPGLQWHQACCGPDDWLCPGTNFSPRKKSS